MLCSFSLKSIPIPKEQSIMTAPYGACFLLGIFRKVFYRADLKTSPWSMNRIEVGGKIEGRIFQAEWTPWTKVSLNIRHKNANQGVSVAVQSLSQVQPHGLQHSRLPCPSPPPGVCSNSCPLSRWRHPTISPSVVPFSLCLQSFPASMSFPMS